MKHTIIIAEAGVNHNGSPEMARRMIREAAAAGADYVKFQTFRAERLVSASAKKADYQRRNCGGDDDSQLAMLKALELSDADFAMLAAECRDVGIGFMSTPFDMESIDSLSSIGMDYWKIPSGEITNLPYLRKIASKGGKAILSTGMSTMAEAEAAVAVLEQAGIRAEYYCAALHHPVSGSADIGQPSCHEHPPRPWMCRGRVQRPHRWHHGSGGCGRYGSSGCRKTFYP